MPATFPRQLLTTRRCVAAGFQHNVSGVNIFNFPKNEEVLSQYIKQVQHTRANEQLLAKSSVLSCDHFMMNCFEPQQKVAAQFEIVIRSKLLSGDIPSIPLHWSLSTVPYVHFAPKSVALSYLGLKCRELQ